jgi:hypothetical protein
VRCRDDSPKNYYGGGQQRRVVMNCGLRLVVLVLAIIGAIAVVAVLAMWFMHMSMMRGGMMYQGVEQ